MRGLRVFAQGSGFWDALLVPHAARLTGISSSSDFPCFFPTQFSQKLIVVHGPREHRIVLFDGETLFLSKIVLVLNQDNSGLVRVHTLSFSTFQEGCSTPVNNTERCAACSRPRDAQRVCLRSRTGVRASFLALTCARDSRAVAHSTVCDAIHGTFMTLPAWTTVHLSNFAFRLRRVKQLRGSSFTTSPAVCEVA